METDETHREPTIPEDYDDHPAADDYPEAPPAGTAIPTGPSRGKRFAWILLLVLLAFLGGFGWQYYRAMNIEDRLERTEQALAVERLRVGLAQAAVAAQSGDYEAARRQMSEFFTATQQQLEELPPEVRALAEDMLRDRDEVITGLSRENYEYATVLYGMLQRFQTSIEPAAAPPAETETETDTAAGPGA